MKSACIFCAIAAGKTPAQIEYQDRDVVAFRDINPKAPVHILIIPKKHLATIQELEAKDTALVGQLVLVARDLAHRLGVAETGYRLVINTGAHSGQVVDHLHIHLLAGRPLSGLG